MFYFVTSYVLPFFLFLDFDTLVQDTLFSIQWIVLFFVPFVFVCFNNTTSSLQFLLPFLLTLCKNLALPRPSVYCSLLSWAPWFMMFVFSLLTIWGLLILSSISWSLWQVTLHLHNLNLFFQAGQGHSQGPFPLFAFFSFCRNRYITIRLCYQYVPASLFSQWSGWWKSPPQTCSLLFLFLLVAQKMHSPPYLCDQNMTIFFHLQHFSRFLFPHHLGFRIISVILHTQRTCLCFIFQWKPNKIYNVC